MDHLPEKDGYLGRDDLPDQQLASHREGEYQELVPLLDHLLNEKLIFPVRRSLSSRKVSLVLESSNTRLGHQAWLVTSDHRRRRASDMHLLLTAVLICLWVAPDLGISELVRTSLRPRQAPLPNGTATPLEVIQVAPPVRILSADGVAIASSCSSVVATYTFANSYGQPFVGSYSPPACDFNRVTWNLTVKSAGRQFDRLGTISLGDIEIFRTSTAEPTANGIIWTYIKDVSPFVSLFKQPQTLIFDLGNIINDIYTGPFNVTLTADYYTVDEADGPRPADVILPISKRLGAAGSSSVFNTPPDNATNLITIPANTEKAIVTVAATGQSAEEFWWSNLLEQDVNDFPAAGTLPGLSPFREVQLYIDGSLAGVVWPFPIIFTGGIVPGFWRPIVGIDAYDLREDEIDISPWLPVLCDNAPHNITLVVSGLIPSADGTAVLSERVNSYWVVTGKVFLWLDANSNGTTGVTTVSNFPAPSIQAVSSLQPVPGTNDSVVDYSVDVIRQLQISATIQTSSGVRDASWQQDLSYIGTGRYSEGGNRQLNNLVITGTDASSSGYQRQIQYPLNVSSLYIPRSDGFGIDASLTRGKDVSVFGEGVFPTGLESFEVESGAGASLSTTQEGEATYSSNSTTSTSSSFGDTRQVLTFSALEGGGTRELYFRDVEARNGTIIASQERDAEAQGSSPRVWLGGPENTQYALRKPGVQNRFGQDRAPPAT